MRTLALVVIVLPSILLAVASTSGNTVGSAWWPRRPRSRNRRCCRRHVGRLSEDAGVLTSTFAAGGLSRTLGIVIVGGSTSGVEVVAASE